MSGQGALLLVASYLLGSVSFSVLVVRLHRRQDLRELGSGNAGATNVLRASGRGPALLVLLLDIAKGLVPVRVAQQLGASAELAAGAGLAAIAGHVFPCFFGFRGGKGVATGFGVFLALFPLAGAAALAVFLAVTWATRLVSVASMSAAAAVPVLAFAFARLGWAPPLAGGALALVCLGSALVLGRHRSNLGRLRAGTERRLGEERA